MSNNKKVSTNTIVIILGAIIVALLCAVTVISTITAIQSRNNNVEPPQTETSIEKVERTLSGKTSDEDRKDALKSAQELLTFAADDMGTGLTPEERAEKIAEGDMTALNPELEEKIRLIDVYLDEDLKNNVFQALIAISKHIAVDGKVEPVSEIAWQVVYVDPEIGIAYVPVSVFHDSVAPFSFEMIYVDGEWRLSPYSFMEIIRLSSSLQEN